MSEFTIQSLEGTVVRGSRNRLDETNDPSIQGAYAAVETFYHAFNNRSLALFNQIWLPHPLIQLNNPLGGIVRGAQAVEAMYSRIFQGRIRVEVEFYDIILYAAKEHAVFAGRERGTYQAGDQVNGLDIRTTRFFQYVPGQGGWRQVHHHGSIDDAAMLDHYQQAVRGPRD